MLLVAEYKQIRVFQIKIAGNGNANELCSLNMRINNVYTLPNTTVSLSGKLQYIILSEFFKIQLIISLEIVN